MIIRLYIFAVNFGAATCGADEFGDELEKRTFTPAIVSYDDHELPSFETAFTAIAPSPFGCS